jgi:hypothetical protein
VANAADFDPEKVASTILAPDAIRDFWANTSSGFERIRVAREQILAELRAARSA